MTTPTVPPIYPKDSIGLSVGIKVNGVLITTSYTAGQLMSNQAVGLGQAKFTCYRTDVTPIIIASDANGTLLQDIIMNRDAVNSGTAVYTISYGLANAGSYEIHPYYRVNDGSANLDWRKQSLQAFNVVPITNSAL